MADVKAGGAFVELSLRSDPFQRALNLAERRLTNIGASITGFGAGVAAFGAGIAASFIPAISAAADAEEQFSKFSTVFGDQTAAVKQFADTLAGELGRSRGEVARFLAEAQDLFVPLGFDRAVATDLSKTLTQLAVDLASFNNQADSDAFNDLTSALTGSSEVMKKYGVIVNETAVKQELLNRGLNPSTATEQQKVLARLNIILRGTSAAQGDAVRTAGSFTNQMKRVTGQIQDLAGAIGDSLLPFLTQAANALGSIVPRVEQWATANRDVIATLAAASTALVAFGGVAIVTGVTIVGLATAIGSVTTAVAALGGVTATVAGIAGVFAAALNPIALLAAGLTVAIGGVVLSFGDWGAALSNVVTTFKTTYDLVVQLIKAGQIQDAFVVAGQGIVTAIGFVSVEIIRAIGNAVQYVLDSVPLIGDIFETVFIGVIRLLSFLNDRFQDSFSATVTRMQQMANFLRKQAADQQRNQRRPGGLDEFSLSGDAGAQRDQEEALRRLGEQGEDVFDRTRTAAEKYSIELEHLNELYDAGAITWDTFQRAIASARGELAKATGETERHARAVADAQSVYEATRTSQERYNAEVARLTSLANAGYISQETYERAIASAREELDASNETLRRGQQIFDQTRTAAEQYQAKLDELQQLADAGAIDRETFRRAVAQAEAQRQLEGGSQGLDQIRVPTQLALTGGQRAGQIFGTLDSISKQQLEIQRQTLEENKRIRQAIERGGLVFN